MHAFNSSTTLYQQLETLHRITLTRDWETTDTKKEWHCINKKETGNVQNHNMNIIILLEQYRIVGGTATTVSVLL